MPAHNLPVHFPSRAVPTPFVGVVAHAILFLLSLCFLLLLILCLPAIFLFRRDGAFRLRVARFPVRLAGREYVLWPLGCGACLSALLCR